ncbi:unnamed protein product [Ceutorhynchus assimilis]|uniref:Division abnormally delayed protein n=1 Tax=Ceutorhynchus assimilis TaxID=467358 RepID=A0A9N9MUT7_9CUCU|nr:unnamed protein product [Ceutorhynchus assimilis]
MASLPQFSVILVVLLCGAGAKNLDNGKFRRDLDQKMSCDALVPFFHSKNITVPRLNENKGALCNGHCCDRATELLLKDQGKRDFATLLRHNSRSLLGPINRTSAVIQNHVWDLANQSENKTLVLFSQVYQSMSVLSRQPIEILYRDIRNYIKIDLRPAKTPDDIVKSVENFFTDLFPLTYHQQTNHPGDFTVKYKQCLKDNMDVIVPFGDYPKEVATSLSKSLEAARLLLQAFSIGIEVLNTTDSLIIDERSANSAECHAALFKMTYCPKCLGLTKNSRPCSGYCLNVLRGCISKYVAELDSPWNSYVEGVEVLVNAIKRNEAGANVDTAIRNLDGQISSAIMYCMEKIKDIDKRVKMSCKIPEFSPRIESLTSESSTLATAIAKSRQPSSKSFPHFPDAHMSSFLSTITKTKGFYGDLADNLCGDESFAEQKDKKCWNGERVADYSKTVVAVQLDAQKYNPEVKSSPNLQQVDTRVATLVDKLRQVHKVAISSLGPNYSESDYMQRDGVDGSGSGNGPDFEGDDDEFSRGSGSGNGPTETDEEPSVYKVDKTEVRVTQSNTPTVYQASRSCQLAPSTILTLIVLTVMRI